MSTHLASTQNSSHSRRGRSVASSHGCRSHSKGISANDDAPKDSLKDNVSTWILSEHTCRVPSLGKIIKTLYATNDFNLSQLVDLLSSKNTFADIIVAHKSLLLLYTISLVRPSAGSGEKVACRFLVSVRKEWKNLRPQLRDEKAVACDLLCAYCAYLHRRLEVSVHWSNAFRGNWAFTKSTLKLVMPSTFCDPETCKFGISICESLVGILKSTVYIALQFTSAATASAEFSPLYSLSVNVMIVDLWGALSVVSHILRRMLLDVVYSSSKPSIKKEYFEDIDSKSSQDHLAREFLLQRLSALRDNFIQVTTSLQHLNTLLIGKNRPIVDFFPSLNDRILALLEDIPVAVNHPGAYRSNDDIPVQIEHPSVPCSEALAEIDGIAIPQPYFIWCTGSGETVNLLSKKQSLKIDGSVNPFSKRSWSEFFGNSKTCGIFVNGKALTLPLANISVNNMAHVKTSDLSRGYNSASPTRGQGKMKDHDRDNYGKRPTKKIDVRVQAKKKEEREERKSDSRKSDRKDQHRRLSRKSVSIKTDPTPGLKKKISDTIVNGRTTSLDTVKHEWEVDPAQVEAAEKVGSGATAVVYRGTWRGTDVAIKILNISEGGMQSPLFKDFTRELEILLRLRHPNLVLFMGASFREHPIQLITEFCAGGSLFDLLHGDSSSKRKVKPVELTWSQKVKLASDIAKGCTYLHAMRPQIIHRDLKSLNILLADPVRVPHDLPQAKVTDFGLSRAILPYLPDRPATMAVGTFHWMAPEVLTSGKYDEKVDVYSYGVLLYELITQRIPYEEMTDIQSPVQIGMAVVQGRRPQLSLVPSSCPSDFKELMLNCWLRDPVRRPSFESIVKSLKGIMEQV